MPKFIILSYNWSIDNEKVAAISVTTHMNAYDAYIELHYLKDGEAVQYTVQLVSVGSNLGKGVLWLWSFICPRTSISCRTLYLFNGYFYHRTAIKNAMYESQTDSHKNRFALRQYDKWKAAHDAKRAMRQKHYTKHYNGKPTKRYLKQLRQIEAGEGISQEALLMML